MAGTDGDERAITVTVDGIEVRKSLENERFPVPAITFEVRSDRSEPVVVKITDQVPEEVPIDNLGFHPEYGSEFWSVGDRSIAFERTFDPDEEFETVYGLRVTNVATAENFLEEPAVEVIAEAERSVRAETNDPLVRNADSHGDDSDAEPAAGENAEPTGGADTDEAAGTSSGDKTTDAVEAVESAESTQGDETAEGDGAAKGPVGVDGDDAGEDSEATEHETVLVDSVAAAREENPDREGRANETEGPVAVPRDSVEARIKHLQSQVSDLAAYTDALESFIDENGSARRLIREQKARTDSLREDVDDIETNVEGHRTRTDSLREDVDDIETNVEGHRKAIDWLEEDIERIDGTIETVERGLDTPDDRLDAIEERMGTLDERFDEMESSIETLLEDVEALQSWRSRFTAVLTEDEDRGNADGAE